MSFALDRSDRQNLAAGLLVIVLIGLAYWMMTSISANTRLEECLQQRRRNCEQLAR